MLLQTVTPVAVVGTVVPLALFLSVTAHLAARNVLGDVDPRRALYVGPFPAIVPVAGLAIGLPSAALLPLALLVDGAMFRWSYGKGTAVAAYMTLIHFAITFLLGMVLVGIAILLGTRPT